MILRFHCRVMERKYFRRRGLKSQFGLGLVLLPVGLELYDIQLAYASRTRMSRRRYRSLPNARFRVVFFASLKLDCSQF